MKKVCLPLEIYRQLEVKKRIAPKREATITFSKDQAIVHFPNIITSELELKKGDKFELTIRKENPPIVESKLIRGKR
ncbi:MAG: hypothetical protein WA139_04775 [Candidatus Aenigmatarchaeota archaeon]